MATDLTDRDREPLQKHAWCGWNKQALTRASASVSISEPQCKWSKHWWLRKCLILERPRMKCFLEVIVPWRMIMTFFMWPVNAGKNVSITVLRNSFLELPEESPHVSVKTFFFAIYGSFCKIYAFPLGVFSILIFAIGRVMERCLLPFSVTF